MVAPCNNLSFILLGTWLFPWEQLKTSFYFRIFFSSISFVDEKDNLKKGSNLGPLGYKGGYNHNISFFPLKIIFKPFPIM
jgi:hypothetical protein